VLTKQTKLCFYLSFHSAGSFVPNIGPESPAPISIGTDYEVLKEPRQYQLELAGPGLNGENYIYVAPTGSGKTLVAALVIANHLQKNKSKRNCRALYIVNTRPLAEQQARKMKEYISNVKVEVYTGDSGNMVADSLKQGNNIAVSTAGKVLDEMRQEKLKFSHFSLLVFDECHHARKSHPYAELMKMYLEYKKDHPLQIIGMTASPGAGDNTTLDEAKTINYLVNLMALLDTSGGIKTVQVNKEELQKYTNSFSFTSKFMMPRNPAEDCFISEVVQAMKNIEDRLEFDDIQSCAYEKWSQGYETRIQQIKQSLELGVKKEFRNKIMGLMQLYNYCTALGMYMDLRTTDALQVMEDYSEFPDDTNATSEERDLKKCKESLIERLKKLPVIENPMLKEIEQILMENFTEEKKSRAILFVRTKKHTDALMAWILENDTLKKRLKPGILTGHSSDRGSGGMTKVEQKEALKKFDGGEVNILLATSVGEEGLDIPECNVVIRYQYVSNEISKVQTEGRARAENSNGYTILSANSSSKYREMKNKELIMLVNKILEKKILPSGDLLQKKIAEIQNRIIWEMKGKIRAKKGRRSCEASRITLKCKKCKTKACAGSDIYTIGENNSHYVVYSKEFKERYIAKTHKKPCFISTTTVFKIHKIHCSECGYDWGVAGFWSKGHLLPVIKCKGFTFEEEGKSFLVKKWSNAPFKPEPLLFVMKYDSEDSSDED